MRNLASVQEILGVSPIEGADRIELVRVLGWQCVAKKGEFRKGDLCVYFEIDSFLPVRPEFEFLRASSYKKTELMGEGFRLRTQKFRGQISQGLVIPVSILEEYGWHGTPAGTDVTDLLGVKKWEIEERATTGGTVVGELPRTVPHTDETRVQAAPILMQEFEGLDYYISTKMDGSSHSISIDESGVHVTGHNYEYKDDGSSSFYEFVKKNGILEKIEQYYREYVAVGDHAETSSLTVQGEYCGPGIQKNRLRLMKPEWYVFTVMINGERQPLPCMSAFCEWSGLTSVPIEETGHDLPSVYPDVETLLARADGEYQNGGRKEGIVIRPVTPVKSETTGDYLSMKVVSNKYLLKNGD